MAGGWNGAGPGRQAQRGAAHNPCCLPTAAATPQQSPAEAGLQPQEAVAGAATPVASSGRGLKLRQDCQPRGHQDASLFHGDGGHGDDAPPRCWSVAAVCPARFSVAGKRGHRHVSRSVQVSHHGRSPPRPRDSFFRGALAGPGCPRAPRTPGRGCGSRTRPGTRPARPAGGRAWSPAGRGPGLGRELSERRPPRAPRPPPTVPPRRRHADPRPPDLPSEFPAPLPYPPLESRPQQRRAQSGPRVSTIGAISRAPDPDWLSAICGRGPGASAPRTRRGK